jgi:hypothetical protein
MLHECPKEAKADDADDADGALVQFGAVESL